MFCVHWFLRVTFNRGDFGSHFSTFYLRDTKVPKKKKINDKNCAALRFVEKVGTSGICIFYGQQFSAAYESSVARCPNTRVPDTLHSVHVYLRVESTETKGITAKHVRPWLAETEKRKRRGYAARHNSGGGHVVDSERKFSRCGQWDSAVARKVDVEERFLFLRIFYYVFFFFYRTPFCAITRFASYVALRTSSSFAYFVCYS